jgi:hypothetical protein
MNTKVPKRGMVTLNGPNMTKQPTSSHHMDPCNKNLPEMIGNRLMPPQKNTHSPSLGGYQPPHRSKTLNAYKTLSETGSVGGRVNQKFRSNAEFLNERTNLKNNSKKIFHKARFNQKKKKTREMSCYLRKTQ